MVRLKFFAINITIILYLTTRVFSKKSAEILVWEDDHFIKELTIKDVPDDCQKIGICSNITIYDNQFFDMLLRRLRPIRQFNVDQVMVPDLTNLGEMEELCASKEEIIWPQAAIDESGQWQYILNTNAIRFQAYRVHRCIESGSSCSKAAIFENIESSCYQENYLRKMVYIDVKNKKLATDFFQVPNCCSCKIS